MKKETDSGLLFNSFRDDFELAFLVKEQHRRFQFHEELYKKHKKAIIFLSKITFNSSII